MAQLQGFGRSTPLKVTNGDKHKEAIRKVRRKSPLKISETFQNASVKTKISLAFQKPCKSFLTGTCRVWLLYIFLVDLILS